MQQLFLFALVATPLALAPAPEPRAAQQEAPAHDDLVVLRCAGLDPLLVDPKDAGLRRVLALVDERIAELPAELDAPMPMPPDALPMLARLLEGSFALRAGLGQEGGFPFYAQLELPGSAVDSHALAQRMANLLAESGMPAAEPDERGLTPLPTPVPAWYGHLRDAFVVSVGEVVDVPLDLSRTGLPPGVAPALYGRLALGQVLGVATDMGAAADPDFEELLDLFDALGLGQADMHWAMGSDAGRSYSVLRMPGFAKAARESGLLPAGPISARALDAIPQDALWASVGANNLSGSLDLLRTLAGDELGLGEDPIEALYEATGVHLERDVLDHFGSGFGMYASDATGGGGVLSIVLFAELGDQQAFAATTSRVEEMLNGMGQAEAEGYVQIRNWSAGEVEYSTLTFPGLPVPFEPTWCEAHGFLFLGLTPQAATAAVAQVASGAPGLRANPRFRAQLPHDPADAIELAWCDVPRFLGAGYGWTSLLCSALVNATRSRQDPARDAGLIMPSYAELAAGAQAYVSLGWVDGDDVVSEARFDRSWLVNATATVGFLVSSPLMLIVPMAATGVVAQRSMAVAELELERSLEAQEEWEQVQAEILEEHRHDAAIGMTPHQALVEDLVVLHYAAAEYAVFNGGRYPDSLQELVTPDANGYTYLGSEELPLDPWGGVYRYAPPAAEADVPRIWSLGADAAEGGEGEDADFDNRQALDEKRREAGGDE